jgi:predicted N-acetyltransferase YhbS
MESCNDGLVIRQATPGDAEACGAICYQAFAAINAEHNFPSDFPSPEVAIGLMAMLFASSDFYCVVGEIDGRIVGSNCLDERSIVMGLGPITIAPHGQNRGVGRRLMKAALDRAEQRDAAGVRLVQAAFHNRSLSLYANLGFQIREPLSCMQGRAATRSVPGCQVRPAVPADLEACNALSRSVHGFARGVDLARAVERATALVAERDGRITGYASDLSFFGHSTAESNQDMQALIASVESFGGPGILVPSRNAGLFRWCLDNGLRVVQPMTLMTLGLYNEPDGAWLPSILY